MTRYYVGYNMPGYMPDNDPELVETLEYAKEYLLTDITMYLEELNLDSRFNDEQVTEFCKVLGAVEKAKPMPCNVYIADYVFWISEE